MILNLAKNITKLPAIFIYKYAVIFILLLNFVSCSTHETQTPKSTKINIETKTIFEIDSLVHLGDSLRYISNAEGIKLFKKAMKLAQFQPDYKLSQICNRIGSCYYYLGDNVSCLRYFQDAYRYAEQQQDYKLMFESLSNIGIHFNKLDDKEKALKFFKKALIIADEQNTSLENNINKSVLLNSLGVSYINLQIKDSALYYLNQSLKLEKDPLYKGRVFNNISNAYRTFKNYDSALIFIEKALDVAKDLNHDNDLSFYKLSKAQILLDKNENTLFLEELGDANRIIETLDNTEFQIRVYEKYIKYYESIQDFHGVYKYKKQKDKLEHDLADKKKNTHFNELVVLFDLEEKERKIAYLKLSEKNKNLTIKYQKTWMVSLVLLIIALSFIFYQYLNRLKKEKRSNKLLVDKNLELIESERKNRNLFVRQEKEIRDYESELKNIKEKVKAGEDIFKENQDLKDKLIIGIQTVLANPDVLCNEKLNLEFLSKKLNTNQKYISHIINDHFKCNFNNYINDKRVKYACELFTQKKYQNYTIEAIAKEVGFKNKVTFNNAFKKNTGITPSAFRIHSLSE